MVMRQKLSIFIVLMSLVAGCAGTEIVPTATAVPAPTATPTSPPPTHTPVPTPTAAPEPDIPEPERPLLMAHYMPWYQTPSVSGYWGWHWTMEHFNPFRKDENGRPNIASYYLPLTGPYDSSDDALLEYQVLLMRLSGIDGVIVELITWNDYGESTSIEPTEEFGYQYLEMVQEVRRATDKAGFMFTADDLPLPLHLFKLRQKYANDAEVNARLDQVFDAILAGDLDLARTILADYPVEP
jgi:hypothetical protein